MKNEASAKPAKRIVFTILSIGLLIGALVPLLVDWVVDRQLNYSLIVLGAIIMIWFIMAPWFIFGKNQWAISWAAAMIFVPIFLYIIELLSQSRGWFLTLGLPSAIIGLMVIEAILWLWIRSRIKPWYAASLSVLLIAFLSFIEHFLARPFLAPDPYQSVRYLVLFCLLAVSLFLAIIAAFVHRFKMLKLSS